MTVTLLRGDARNLPLADHSVDLIVTSPPYFGLRSYTDGGEHYDRQIGSEDTPAEFVDALIECTRDMVRVLKPTGSMFINLGDKYGRPGGGTDRNQRSLVGAGKGTASRPATPSNGSQVEKSLIGIPWRYAIRCMDELGLILRAEQIWSKPNGMPESVTDRVRRSHENWFHFTVLPRYYSAVDEIREPASGYTRPNHNGREARGGQKARAMADSCNPLGRLPGSVWEIATQPLVVPPELEVDHYAAFPMEWPRRLILGWSPREVCSACGEGRRPVIHRDRIPDRPRRTQGRAVDALSAGHGPDGRAGSRFSASNEITGCACACPDTSASATPGVVLDPFGGTGTTAMVASALGRTGISVDASADYCRLATWRTTDPKERAKAVGADPAAVVIPDPDQVSLLDLIADTPT